jgi:hypothetical protein
MSAVGFEPGGGRQAAERVNMAPGLLDEMAAFSARIGRKVEVTIGMQGSGYVALTEIEPPLLRHERCLWSFASLSELRRILRAPEEAGL